MAIKKFENVCCELNEILKYKLSKVSLRREFTNAQFFFFKYSTAQILTQFDEFNAD